MALSRNFFVVGTAFLMIGILLGGYMGASENFTLQPVHAHLNLLGFTLMMVFGLVYRVVPAMAASALARWHFWLHALGTAMLLSLLALYLLDIISPAVMPISLIAEIAIFGGVVLFLVNLLRNGATSTTTTSAVFSAAPAE